MPNPDFMNDLFKSVGIDSNPVYCVKCGYTLDFERIQRGTGGFRRIFWCPNKKCERFGIVVVVGKTKR